MKIIKSLHIIFFIVSFILCGCSRQSDGTRDSLSDGGKMKYAENLFMKEFADYTLVRVRNPWDTLQDLHRYVLIDRDKPVPQNLPPGEVIKIPVGNALIFSAVHSGLVGELGAGDAIGGVCNAPFVTDSILKGRIKRGEVADCGSDMNPDIERIITLKPEVIMLSPFESGDRYAKIRQLGIPMVECADYMENSALAQAEWMKFYGLLFGKKAEADKRFSTMESRYLSMKEAASKTTSRPRVLLDRIYGQSWSVPGGNSTIGKLIEDAGGENPFAKYGKSGGVPLAPEKVLADADDADIWIVRYNQDSEKTLGELSRDAAVNSQFKAFKLGNVYGCNTRVVPFFDETPFNPDLLLADLIKIFHPELTEGDTTLRYFKKMER